MKTRPYLLQALTPLHAGTGQSVGVLDLPIARMRATGIPFVPGSSLKGVLREQLRVGGEGEPRLAALFGPARHKEKQRAEGDNKEDLEHAGALVVGDARLVALPVRSFFGTFALVSSPLLLMLAHRDMEGARSLPEPPRLPPGKRLACPGSRPVNVHNDRVYLEELDLKADNSLAQQVDAWAGALLGSLPDAAEREQLSRRLVVVDDETMSFLWETATQVDTRVRIDGESGTVAPGALWTEESLPAETLLMGVLAASPSLRPGLSLDAEEVLAAALPERQVRQVQLGGKATVGRGRCRLLGLGG